MIAMFTKHNRKVLGNKSGGFTLIELLVVIAIIGILSSVVLASLNTARLKARDARRISDIGQLQLALAVYYDAFNNKYPLALSSLVPTYIAKLPTDPLSATNYTFAALGTCTATNGTSYHLGASLEDITSSSLVSDADGTVGTICTGSQNSDFSGLSAEAGGAVCSATAGTTQTGGGNGTESCYDTTPL